MKKYEKEALYRLEVELHTLTRGHVNVLLDRVFELSQDTDNDGCMDDYQDEAFTLGMKILYEHCKYLEEKAFR